MRSLLVPPLATHGLRVVAPLLPPHLARVDTGGARVAYLTFDDGPTPTITAPLLDLLARYDARATHFLVGAHAAKHPALVRALAAAGHRLGNHSYTHPSAWRTPAATMDAEMARATTTIEGIAGVALAHLRPPYGHLTGALHRWGARHGQQVVLWDAMPGDFLRTATASGIAAFVRRHLRPGGVVVLHDNPRVEGVTLPALRRLLPELAAEGWRFERL
jgi:peptidoglycan/xylan/chitin deacetylase (PgdA/CDA1 family)